MLWVRIKPINYEYTSKEYRKICSSNFVYANTIYRTKNHKYLCRNIDAFFVCFKYRFITKTEARKGEEGSISWICSRSNYFRLWIHELLKICTLHFAPCLDGGQC